MFICKVEYRIQQEFTALIFLIAKLGQLGLFTIIMVTKKSLGVDGKIRGMRTCLVKLMHLSCMQMINLSKLYL